MLSFKPVWFKMGFNECEWNEVVNFCLGGASSLACNTEVIQFSQEIFGQAKKWLNVIALEDNLSNHKQPFLELTTFSRDWQCSKTKHCSF